MSKVALLLIAFIALSTAEIEVPSSLFQGNYDDFKTFVNAFMNGYTGTTYTLPADCLDSASQGKLDSDMVDVIINLLKFHPYDAYVSLKIFTRDLEAMSWQCGLNQVPQNLNEDLKKKGSWWMIGNLLLHKIEIESYTLATLVDLLGGEFNKAGKDFGMAVKFMIPPPSTIKVGDLLAASGKEADIIAFGKGLLQGFEGQVATTGPCYNNIYKLGDILVTSQEALEKVLSKNLPAMDDLIADIKEIEPQMKLISSSCPFDTLFTNIHNMVASTEGLKILYTNYYKSLKTIDADIAKILKCSSDYFACGQSLGNTIDLLFNWNLEKPSKIPSFLSY